MLSKPTRLHYLNMNQAFEQKMKIIDHYHNLLADTH